MKRFRIQPLLAASLAVLGTAGITHAQYAKPELGSLNREVLPYETGEVGVDEKLGIQVPLDVSFNDEAGNAVTVGSYLNQGRPVILWLGYYECPMLCDDMSSGMVSSVKAVQLDAGKEFAILNVSIDPEETPRLANAKKATYLQELGQPGNASAWNLLTGSQESIKTLTDAVGYKFKPFNNKGVEDFAHPAVLVILSPSGKVTRYLYPDGAKQGVQFDSRTMQLSLIEAGEGKVGTILDRVIMTCLQWDSHTGKYTKNVVAIMRWAAAFTVVTMAIVFVPLWMRSARGKDKTAAA